MTVVLIFIGFASILGQVVLLRELAVAFFGSELIYLLAIALWLIWTGLGALIGRGAFGKGGRTHGCAPTTLLTGIVSLGVALPLEVVFVRGIRIIFGATPGAFMPFEQQIAAIALTLAPAGLLLGFLFVQAAREYVTRGGRFASAYGLESLGGVFGGLASTFVLAGHVPAFATAILCCSITFAIGFYASMRSRSMRLFFGLGTLASLGMLIIAGNHLDRATLRWQFPGVLDSQDSPYGRLTLTERGGQIVLFENGALSFETQATAPEELAHLALLQHEAPKRNLLLGGGVSGILQEILKHQPEQIDYVELDASLIDLARRYMPREIQTSLAAPSVRLVISDGRKCLRKTSQRYDVILVDMPEPTSGQANRYYTREFFEECTRKLQPGGLVAFRLPSAEQYWTAGLARRNTSIYRALKSAFPHIVVLPGSANVFVASREPLARDPQISSNRYAARHIEAKLICPPYIHYLYTNDRFAEIERILAQTDAPTNSDIRPICYQLTLVVWLSRFYRAVADFQAAFGTWIWGFLILSGVFVWILRQRAAAAKLALVAIAGFAGMVIEFAVLLRFQTASGVLFRDIGLLLGGFMAGLAVSPVVGRWAARATRGGFVLVLFFALFCSASALLFHWEGMRSIAVGMGWLLVTGCGVGALFCYATEKTEGKGAMLYAADLLGGSLGALVGSLILLPSLGLDVSSLWVGALALLAMVLA
jgi:spermidine synthase